MFLLCVCLCLSVRSYISKTTWTKFAEFSVDVACGCGSVFLWWGYDIDLWMTSDRTISTVHRKLNDDDDGDDDDASNQQIQCVI